jgi:hypothetical protein
MTTNDILWKVLSKVSEKESKEVQLEPESDHSVSLIITGTVNNQPVNQQITSVASVGKDGLRAPSHAPDALILAVMLSKLNAKTRAVAVQKLSSEIDFNDPDCVSAEFVDMANDLRDSVRKSLDKKPVKGALRCTHKINDHLGKEVA